MRRGDDGWYKALSEVKQGQVLVVDLGGAQGQEQEKTRPCLVVSAREYNGNGRLLIVVPITSLDKESGSSREAKPHEVELPAGCGGLSVRSAAVPGQVRTIDRTSRVKEILGFVSEDRLGEVSDLLAALTAPDC